jgi:DnaK suppressor protein
MEEKCLDTFRETLIALRQELEQLNRDSKEASGTVVLDQSKVGRLSRMDALQAQQMAQETARRRQAQVQRIDSALRRMDAGEYGYCLICGDDIGPGRLKFDPASTRCMGCMDS